MNLPDDEDDGEEIQLSGDNNDQDNNQNPEEDNSEDDGEEIQLSGIRCVIFRRSIIFSIVIFFTFIII